MPRNCSLKKTRIPLSIDWRREIITTRVPNCKEAFEPSKKLPILWDASQSMYLSKKWLCLNWTWYGPPQMWCTPWELARFRIMLSWWRACSGLASLRPMTMSWESSNDCRRKPIVLGLRSFKNWSTTLRKTQRSAVRRSHKQKFPKVMPHLSRLVTMILAQKAVKSPNRVTRAI